MQIIVYILMAIGLSIDAFSFAIIYGMNPLRYKKMILLSVLVGIFHFMMPSFGALLSKHLFQSLVSKAHFLAGIVFLILSIEMFSSLKEEEKTISLDKLYHLIFFAFTVSLDSFSVGIVLNLAQENIFQAASIFSLVSFLFTYVGLRLGKWMSQKYSTKATLFGSLLLLLLSLRYFLFV